MNVNVLWFSELGLDDLDQVGGKNSSLGEMVQNLSKAGVRVPNGFATTADAYRRFIAHQGLGDSISAQLADLDTDDIASLTTVGSGIRAAVVAQPFPADLEAEIRTAYAELVDGREPPVVRRTLQRHRRGPARRVVRGAAGDLPEHPRC